MYYTIEHSLCATWRQTLYIKTYIFFFFKGCQGRCSSEKINCTSGIRTRDPSLVISGAPPAELWCSCQPTLKLISSNPSNLNNNNNIYILYVACNLRTCAVCRLHGSKYAVCRLHGAKYAVCRLHGHRAD